MREEGIKDSEGHVYPVVESSKHLGSIIKVSGNVEEEVLSRISKARVVTGRIGTRFLYKKIYNR